MCRVDKEIVLIENSGDVDDVLVKNINVFEVKFYFLLVCIFFVFVLL